MAVRTFPGDEIRSARVAVLVSWLLLGAGIVAAARYTLFPSFWYSALFVTLASPHALSATALVMTEGPALLFAILGSLMWVEFLSLPRLNLDRVAIGIAGGSFGWSRDNMSAIFFGFAASGSTFCYSNGGNVPRGLAHRGFCQSYCPS
jgi:hypothetical protein